MLALLEILQSGSKACCRAGCPQTVSRLDPSSSDRQRCTPFFHEQSAVLSLGSTSAIVPRRCREGQAPAWPGPAPAQQVRLSAHPAREWARCRAELKQGSRVIDSAK